MFCDSKDLQVPAPNLSITQSSMFAALKQLGESKAVGLGGRGWEESGNWGKRRGVGEGRRKLESLGTKEREWALAGELEPWASETARRIRTMCRHVRQVTTEKNITCCA